MGLQNRTARPGRLGTLVVLIAVLGLIIPTTALGILAIERVSASSTGAQGNGDSWVCKPSADGRFVVFYSESSQLVPGDTNHVGDVFVRDRLTGRVERANVSSAGGQSDAQSYDADISADGRYVVFASRATNLIGAGLDTNASSDVFVRDRFAHTTRRVSVGAAGVQGSGDSDGARISTDGRYVVFVSAAANLVGTEDTNARSDIFRRDRIGNTTVRVSLGGSGLQADGYSDDPAVNASGRYVAFESAATNLVGAGVDTNSQDDIYVRDIDSGTTSRASVSSSGTEPNFGSFSPAISADGRNVVFSTYASNMVTGDTNGTNDIMIRNRLSNTTTMVSKGIGGASGDDRSLFPSISGDGKLVAYQSLASNLVAGDTNGVYDIFVTRVSTGATERISKSAADGQSLGNSEEPWLSADGRYIGFSATATNLVAGDTNGVVDVFLATRAVMTTRVTRTPSAYSRTYSRIHGVAKYTLSATLGNEIGVPIAGARAYLQRYNTSSKKWKNLKTLRSNSRGKVGVVFRSTATSTRYYRWYVPAAADHTKAYGSKQKIRVK